MSREHGVIPCGPLLLEASIAEASSPDVAVLCHPHPLYGGNMDNNVVTSLAECLFRMGWTTVRFNFRGVGRSSGSFGEGFAETEDLTSVVDYVLKGAHRRVHLAGYSFGAWVVLNGLRLGLQADSVILVSPPVDFMDFQSLSTPDCPTLVVVGDSDTFCTTQSLRSWLSGQPISSASPMLEILQGCDHFYWEFEEALTAHVTAFARGLLTRDGSGKSDEPVR